MRARQITAPVLISLLLLTGCNTMVAGRGAQAGVPTGGPPPRSPTATSAPPTASGPTPAVFRLGQTGTVTGPDGQPLADITVADAVFADAAPDGLGQAPTRGSFLSVQVTVANLGDTVFAVAPLDFVALYPDGSRLGFGDGSRGLFAFPDLLDTASLPAGQTVSGSVVFDVDPQETGLQIVYVDLAGRILGSWAVEDAAAPTS